MDIVDHVVGLYMRINALEGRLSRSVRQGTVSEVDTAAQTVRLKLNAEGSEDGDFLSPPIPYGQIAGPSTGLKVHTPPTVGQSMTVFAPTGDLRQSVAMPFTWSDQAPSPGQTADPAMTYGQVRIDVTPSSVKATIGGLIVEATTEKFEITIGGGKLTLTAENFLSVFDKAKFEGSELHHNDANVGDTHKHIDTQPGGGKSGVPEQA